MGNAGGTITQSHERVPFCLNIEWRERESSRLLDCVLLGAFDARPISTWDVERERRNGGKKKKKKKGKKGGGGKELFPLRVPIFAQPARARKHEGKTREIRRSFRVADTQREFLFFELVHFVRSCYTMRIFFSSSSFLPFFFLFLEISYGTVSSPLFRCFSSNALLYGSCCGVKVILTTVRGEALCRIFLLDLVNKFLVCN